MGDFEKTTHMLVKGGEEMIPQMFKVAHANLTEEALTSLREHLKAMDAEEGAKLAVLSAKMNVSVEVAKAGDTIMKGIVKSFIAAHVPPELAAIVFMLIDNGGDVNVHVVTPDKIKEEMEKAAKKADGASELENLLSFRKKPDPTMVN